MLSDFLQSIGDTGALKINALIFLTKPLMKIAAAYEQAMVWKTLLDCAGKENQS